MTERTLVENIISEVLEIVMERLRADYPEIRKANLELKTNIKKIADVHKEFLLLQRRVEELNQMVINHSVGVQNVYNEFKAVKDATW